jgi:hypothetical protein
MVSLATAARALGIGTTAKGRAPAKKVKPRGK